MIGLGLVKKDGKMNMNTTEKEYDVNDTGLIREADVLVNSVVEMLDPFEELPALTKKRTEEFPGVFRNKRPIIIGRDLNPRRKYRIEL